MQIDGPRRRVYIKFVSAERMQSILQNIQGQQEYNHDNGEIPIVKVELAGMGVRRVRVAGLPPEVKEPVLRDAMSKYEDVKIIQEEQWPNQYRYKASNWVKIVELNLKKHVPSHMFIAGHRVPITYEGQPPTCYNCNEQGRHSVECPYRRSSTPTYTSNRAESWAHAVKHGTTRQQQEEGGRDITYMSNESDIEPPAKESPPSDGVVGTHSQCDLTQLSTKETLPSTISQKQDGERTQPHELMESGREDTRKDSNEMETVNEVEEMTPDIRCGGTPSHQHRETIKNGNMLTTSNMPPYTK